MAAVLHGPGEGESLEMGPNRIVLKATGEDTDGRFFLSETTVAAGFPGPPPHTHEQLLDMFYVLEGTLTFRFKDKQVEAAAGTTVFVPAGVPHTYFEAHGPTRYLIILTPRLRDLISALAEAPREQHDEIMRRFESEIVV